MTSAIPKPEMFENFVFCKELWVQQSQHLQWLRESVLHVTCCQRNRLGVEKKQGPQGICGRPVLNLGSFSMVALQKSKIVPALSDRSFPLHPGPLSLSLARLDPWGGATCSTPDAEFLEAQWISMRNGIGILFFVG